MLAAGCGSSAHTVQSPATTPQAGSVTSILARPGANVSVVPGTEDYAPGPIRFSFLLIDNQGAPVNRPHVRVSVATSTDARPLAVTSAALQPVGVPGVDVDTGDITKLYVSHFQVPSAGKYVLGIETLGAKPVQAAFRIQVAEHAKAPAVGSKAIASNTPTIASTHGNFRELTTRTPPDKALLRYSVADSLAAHAPFVVVFATPKFCTSRTCGPVVDVVDAARKQLARHRCPLHPRRGLQGQQPGARLQRVVQAVASSDRAVDVSRRQRTDGSSSASRVPSRWASS